MPFHEGYGLHDATWRSSFGGDIYQYGGSHGCVNLPEYIAAEVYDNIEVGTIVVIF
ncbi:MAG: L,D-transpeptidase [Lachnospiraceae bacterium]|nr:L,D-transpeptidase [Candidatus Equihabitans merdae]